MTDHTKTIISLPDQIRGGRTPWTGTISGLLALMGDDDHAMEKARLDAQELGIIDPDKINDEDAEVEEVERLAKRRAEAEAKLRAAVTEAVEEGANVSALARAAGVTRQTIYRWAGVWTPPTH